MTSFTRLARVALALGVAVAVTSTASAQPQAQKPIENPPFGTAILKANVGSFKILPRGVTPVQGTLSMSFTGTVLVSGLAPGGTVSVSGNVRKEYSNPKIKREVYFGTGTITITGKTQAIQWFGRNLNANFKGYALIRAFGEFDKNLETGQYWYADQPEKKFYWMANGATPITVPRNENVAPGMGRPAPRPRSKGDA